MEEQECKESEALVDALNDDESLRAYRRPLDNYHTAFLPRILGNLLVWCGNTVYGNEPSYAKFRAVEVIARVPYHSWDSAAFTLLTLCYTSEERASRLSQVSRFSRMAQDNETMHVVVISSICRRECKTGVVRHTLIPMLFAFFYFWASYLMYLVQPRWSLELNYLFEQHAFDQYSRFITTNKEALSHKTVSSDFLREYGRNPRNQYEFFRSVRNDEIIHRNRSIHEIEVLAKK